MTDSWHLSWHWVDTDTDDLPSRIRNKEAIDWKGWQHLLTLEIWMKQGSDMIAWLDDSRGDPTD